MVSATVITRRSCSRTACKACWSTDATGSVLSGGTDNPPGNTGTDWANLYNTIQSLRDRPLAAAHPDHLRRRCRSRLRSSDRGDVVPPVDRDGRDVGHPAGATSRRRPRVIRSAAWARIGSSLRFRMSRGTTAGAAITRRGEKSPRSRARWAGPTSGECRAGRARPTPASRSPRRSSTSPPTRSRSTATIASKRRFRSAICRISSCRPTRAGSTPARTPSWSTPGRSTASPPRLRTSC